jgi:hypothetical protein
LLIEGHAGGGVRAVSAAGKAVQHGDGLRSSRRRREHGQPTKDCEREREKWQVKS